MALVDGEDRNASLDTRIEIGNNQRDVSQSLQVEALEFEEALSPINPPRQKKYLLVPIAMANVFLASINLVAGMMASQGESWKITFFGLFATWLLLLAIGLFIDLYRLEKAQLIRRSLCHVGSCVFMLYLIITTIKTTSETLPQWIPLTIDAGLGTSVGLQNISSDSRNLIFDYIYNIVGTLCGGVQIMFQGGSPSSGQRLPSSQSQES